MNRREALKTLSAMLGGSIALPIASGFLAGCGPSVPGTNNEAWRPRALTARQNEIVTIIAERIIPQTDTPGAAAARVNEFIDLIVNDWFSTSEKKAFFDGMDAALAYCSERYKKDFTTCSDSEQTGLLIELENEYLANGKNSSLNNVLKNVSPRAEFLNTMKQFTLIGYYTSETGASEELRVPPMGQYLGNEPFDENSRAWAW